jgi:hypothetical protein
MTRPCIFCDELGRSRDHVLLDMFGSFENALTNLNVCQPCNKHFGDTLERGFGLNSAEAIFRLMFGVKSPEKAHHVHGDRITLTYLEDDELKGARIRFAYNGASAIQAEMPPQVIIQHKSLDVPHALLEDEITAQAIVPFLHGANVIFPGDLGETTMRLRRKMEAVGFVFAGPMERFRVAPRSTTPFLMRVKAIVDDAIAREVTKIAVNFVAVSVGYDFIMLPDFRPARKYARYGDPCLRHSVHTSAQSIEMDLTRDRYGDGHMMTLDWSFATGEVIVLICFFNRITHQVKLAENVNAIWRNIRTAYHFDTATRRATRLKMGAGEHMKLI